MKERTLEGFGPRLASLRKASGLTQAELGAKVGVSYRVIAHYEREEAQPPGPILPDLAQALGVTIDGLLDSEPLEPVPPRIARLRRHLRRVEELSPSDQRTVLKLVDALLETRRRKDGA